MAADEAMADLGRKLFFDPSLSASGKLACATCHDPRYAFGPPPGKAIATGGARMDKIGTRAVPSLRYLNHVPDFAERTVLKDGGVAPAGGLTWDGRAGSLHEQARIPLLAPNEMANANVAAVVSTLRHGPYAPQFRQLFGADVFRRPSYAFEQALRALEAYQQTPAEFFPYSSKYDAYLRGEAVLDDREKRGLEVFNHSAGVGGVPPAFTDFEFDNIGAPRNSKLPVNADPHYFDMGLCGPSRTDLSGRKYYCGLFRTPSLRNVALRDAFFHNGVFGSLREVLQFYQQRDVLPWNWYPRNPDGTVNTVNDLPIEFRRSVNIDPPFRGREGGSVGAISDSDIDDLLAFLQTLTDGYQPAARQLASAGNGG
jgi:cytochrome c peroxidase